MFPMDRSFDRATYCPVISHPYPHTKANLLLTVDQVWPQERDPQDTEFQLSFLLKQEKDNETTPQTLENSDSHLCRSSSSPHERAFLFSSVIEFCQVITLILPSHTICFSLSEGCGEILRSGLASLYWGSGVSKSVFFLLAK